MLEKTILDTAYQKLISHINRIYRKRIRYNMLEDMLIKYLWSAIGLVASSIPIMFPQYAGRQASAKIAESSADAVEDHTEGFIYNKRYAANSLRSVSFDVLGLC